MKTLRWWVGLWDRREHPRALATVRILLAAVLLVDWLTIAQLGLVDAIFAPLEGGGIGDPFGRETVPWLYGVVPPERAGVVIFGALVTLTVMVGAGVMTPVSCGALVLVWAQAARGLPLADRGIDTLCRNALLILTFSGCFRAWSVDAKLMTGRWSGDSQPIPSWPRYLLICQVVLMYFTAGTHKYASSWTPFGDFSALYIAMNDPAFAMLRPSLLAGVFPATQALTAGSLLWEVAAPMMLFALYFRDTRIRPGGLRSMMNRLNFRTLYLLIGASFHMGTAVSLQLGIFPWAMLSLYPAFFHPDELQQFMRGLRGGDGDTRTD
ncbi:MAG: HTTM domain-containing protein [Myxococcota bacterium]